MERLTPFDRDEPSMLGVTAPDRPRDGGREDDVRDAEEPTPRPPYATTRSVPSGYAPWRGGLRRLGRRSNDRRRGTKELRVGPAVHAEERRRPGVDDDPDRMGLLPRALVRAVDRGVDDAVADMAVDPAEDRAVREEVAGELPRARLGLVGRAHVVALRDGLAVEHHAEDEDVPTLAVVADAPDEEAHPLHGFTGTADRDRSLDHLHGDERLEPVRGTEPSERVEADAPIQLVDRRVDAPARPKAVGGVHSSLGRGANTTCSTGAAATDRGAKPDERRKTGAGGSAAGTLPECVMRSSTTG